MMGMGNRLSGKTALVTGAGGGIGAEICRSFAGEGASVAVTDIDIGAANTVAAGITGAGGRAAAIAFDVTDAGATGEAADRTEIELGPIDIWVNNAGVSSVVPFLDCTDELWNDTLRINLTGTFIGCREAIGRMLPRKRGVILNMSSQSGKRGSSHYAAYCASKFGIIGLTQSLAVEFASSGIRVNALCPGVVMTPLWEAMKADYAAKRGIKPEEVIPYLEKRIPMGRLCTPADIAAAAVFLASDESAYITGEAINISGGQVMS
jgi:NAD(P)-dependent dehydrogenase (short-subunit alcohol dehydrogenase family)